MRDSLPTLAKRDLSFDLLRGLAVLYIVGYYHIQEVWTVHLPGGLAGWLARVALALFCFLSGLLLSQGKVICHWSESGPFLIRRLLRIYPLYLGALLAFCSLGLCPWALFWPASLLVNTLLNRSVLTLWFVSMIFLFYLVTPLYLYRPSPAKTLLLTAGILFILAVLHFVFHGVDPRIFANLPAFALGIFLTQKPAARAFFLESPQRIVLASAVSITLLAWWTANRLPDDSTFADLALSIIWFIAALPLLFAAARKISQRLPGALIHFLATASFVLYLSHRICYFLGEKLLPLTGAEHFLYVVCGLLPLALTASYFLQKAYDELLRRASYSGM